MQPLMPKIKNRQIVVFADDLTGAMEVGLQSFPAVVLNNIDSTVIRAASAKIVINTQTRGLSAEHTYQVTKEKAQVIKKKRRGIFSLSAGAVIYYKIDSTMRGHIGTGIKALREILQSDLVAIAPALPQNGRITRNGVHYVDNIQVYETQYAKDIITSSPTSYIPDIIGYQLGESIQLISLDVVQQGWQNIKTALEKQPQSAVVAIDAVIPEDLDNIAEAIRRLNTNALSVGSAGLFRAICRVLGKSNNQVVPGITDWTRQLPNTPKDGQVIVIAGSLNQQTNTQIETAIAALSDKLQLLELDVNKVIAKGKSRASEIERLRGQILSFWQAKKHIVVRTNRTFLKCSQQEEDDIAAALGEVINDDSIIGKSALLLLTGGQTAYFVTQVLGASGIEVKGEIEKFIPVGILIGGKYEGLPVVTKAGGFGSQQVIANILTAGSMECET